VSAADANHQLDSRRGWVVVAAAFVSTFVVFGVAYSFGAFFDSMAEEFGTGKGATALMFSITTCWYFLLGLGSGKLADRFGPRPVLIVGALLLGTGLLLTSRVSSRCGGGEAVDPLFGHVGVLLSLSRAPAVRPAGAWPSGAGRW